MPVEGIRQKDSLFVFKGKCDQCRTELQNYPKLIPPIRWTMNINLQLGEIHAIYKDFGRKIKTRIDRLKVTSQVCDICPVL